MFAPSRWKFHVLVEVTLYENQPYVHRTICATDVQNLLLHVSALRMCHRQGACTVGKAVLVLCYVYIPVDVRLGYYKLISTLRTVHALLKWSYVIFIYLCARLRVSGYI